MSIVSNSTAKGADTVVQRREERLTHVPSARVGTIVQSFKRDGALQVRRTLEDDKRHWTVTATFVA